MRRAELRCARGGRSGARGAALWALCLWAALVGSSRSAGEALANADRETADGETADAEMGPPTAPVRLREVAFHGRVYFREETLRGFVSHPPGAPLDPALLERDRATIEARYRERGYLRAAVQVLVQEQVQESVPVPGPPRVQRVRPEGTPDRIAHFFIDAGERAQLLAVEINGNRGVDDDTLREGFFSRAPEPLGALTRAGFFHKPYLDQDAQRLTANYYRKGYLEARVWQTRVSAEPDLDGVRVSLDVVEGPVYELAGVEVIGDLPPGVSAAALRAGFSLADGDVADILTLQQEADRMLDVWRELGYPHATFEQRVTAAAPPSGDPDRRAIRLTFAWQRGPQARIRALRIAGEPGTRPHVILREIDVKPGEIYPYARLKAAQQRLMALGYFQSVNLQTLPTEDPALVDIEVSVVEQPTFLFSPTAFVAAEGLVGVLVAGDRNLFGQGLFASFVGQVSALRQLFDVSVTDPRLAGTRHALTLEAHRRELGYAQFRVRTPGGGGIRGSFLMPGDFRLGMGFMAERTGTVLAEGLPRIDAELFPGDAWRNVLDLSFAWDRRDQVLSPRRGVLAEAGLSYTGPWTGAGISALDGRANLRVYVTPVGDITFKSNTEVATVWNPHGGEVAVTDRYFLGNIGSVRGYFPRSITPLRRIAAATGETLALEVGGVFRFVENAELEFPLWPMAPLRGFAFVDAGNAWDEGEARWTDALDRDVAGPMPLGLFWAAGGGVLFDTPVFPLRLQLSTPLTRRMLDRPWDFFVGVGSAF